jgi:hypothetical protein
MKNLVFFTFFLILITFSVHQNAIAETEEEQERKKAIEEAGDPLKREIVNKESTNEAIETEKDKSQTKQKLGKMKKFLPTQDEFDEITLRTVWKYVDKQFSSNEEYKIESIQSLLRDVGRVYDPVVNKYKIATLQIEIIKYEDKVSLENYWINEKKSNLEFMFENAYLIGSPNDDTKCFFNYTTDGAITICKTDQFVIQSIVFDKYQEHFKYTKSKKGSEKLELTPNEITTGITETILKKLQSKDVNYDYELYKILESNREIKEKEYDENKKDQEERDQEEKKQRENNEKNKNKSLGIEKDKKYGIQNFSCIKDEFALITISGQFNNNHIKKDKVSFEIAFFDYEKNMIYKNTANLLEIDEYETKRFLGNLKIDKNFGTCTIKLNN